MKKLSISIFGNVNNYPMILAEGFKRLGHDVLLFINRKELLHRPEALRPHWNQCYPKWIKDCSHITDEDIAYQTPVIDKVIDNLSDGRDLVILNDIGVSLSPFLNQRHVAFLTGSDLSYYADFKTIGLRTSNWSNDFKKSIRGQRNINRWIELISRQRDGILNAKVVCFAEKGLIPLSDLLLDEIGVKEKSRMMLYFANIFDLNFTPKLNKGALTFFSGCRLLYNQRKNRNLTAMDFKGTDILLHGFAKYLRAGGKGILKLPRKGQDLDEALALIEQLKIADRISLYEEMPLYQFYEEMVSADVVIDQVGTSFPGMVTGDAFALGRPVIANFRNEIFFKRFGMIPPGFNVRNSDELYREFLWIEANQYKLKQIGIESRKFADTFLSPVAQADELLRQAFN